MATASMTSGRFMIGTTAWKNVTVRVFNRYGNSVYRSKDYRNNWNGTYKRKTSPDGISLLFLDREVYTNLTEKYQHSKQIYHSQVIKIAI